MSALENREDVAAELAEEKRILAATIDMLHEVEAERDAMKETQRKFGMMMHELMDERDRYAKELGECSGALQTADREIAALRVERDNAEAQKRLADLAHQELCDMVPAFRGETVVECVARLVAERDALREDADLLRWIDVYALCVDMAADPDNRVQVWCGSMSGRPITGRTLREAIANAREATP